MRPPQHTVYDSAMECRILGPIELISDGRPLNLGGPQQRRVLAALLSDPGRVLTYARLVEVLWPDGDEPPNARRSAITYVSRLRAAVGEGVVGTTDAGYVVDSRAITVDADRFVALVEQARTVPPARAVETLDEALHLWRGPVFGDLGGEWWARPMVTRLEELRLVALADRLDALTISGWDGRAVAEAASLVDAHPLREQFVERAMRGLHALGQTADAVRVFQRYRSELADRTGLDPSTGIIELERSLIGGADIDEPDHARGRSLRGYVLHELIGEGSFGSVYRATQPGVGRDVAVKVIRAELADDRSFVRRFEAEAQLVARLEHPHVVPLYDFWREPGGAFLVFRLLRGGSADDLLARSGPLDLERATRVLDDVGSALSAAHGSHVVHRDVKPANVLFDEAGVAYLSDFGIAASTAIEPANPQRWSAGSVLYASPEQLRDGTDDARADQYALAVTMWELLTGRAPFDAIESSAILATKLTAPLPPVHEHRTDLAAAHSAVLARASAVHPNDRFADIGEFVAAWRRAMASSTVGSTGPAGIPPAAGAERRHAPTMAGADAVVRNPYVGLRAFREGDTADFHGRHALTDSLAATAAAAPFLAVVGPSGSGKSSLVLAGLIPRLRGAGCLVASMTPDTDPMTSLSEALSQIALSDQAPAVSVAALRRPDGVRAAARAISSDGELVLVIDQLEELWTLVGDDDRQAFLEALHAPIEAELLRVIATVRADFFDRPLADPVLGPLTAAHTFGVTPMSTSELHDAIAAPAEAVGVRFEPALVSRLVAETADQPGSLPLLQFALAELFDGRTGAVITNDANDELGGLAGALARHADAIVAGLGGVDTTTVRRMFARLVTPGEGSEDTRRRVPMRELVGVPQEIIAAFVDGRLITSDRDRGSREPTFEVAHEVLLRSWPQLRSWLAADRAWLRELRGLSIAAAAWEAGGRDDSDLARGARLAVVAELAADHDGALTGLERDFLDHSVDQAARHEREASERLALQVRQNRRLRRSLVGLVSVLVVALVAGSVAVVQRRRADEQQQVAVARGREAERQRSIAEQQRAAAETQQANAEAQQVIAEQQRSVAESERDRATDIQQRSDVRRLVAESALAQSTDLSLALLLAAEAHQREHTVATRGALESALVSNASLLGFLRGDQGYTSVALTPDGDELLAGGSAGRIDRWDVSTSTLVGSIQASDDTIRISLSPDGRVVAATDRAGMLTLWDADTGDAIGTPLALDAFADGDTTARPTFSADGTEVFVPTKAGAIVAVDVTAAASEGGQRTVIAGTGQKVGDVAISPDGTQMVVPVIGVDGMVELVLHDTATGSAGALIPTTLPALVVTGLHWSPDGSRIAAATGGGSASGQVFDVATGDAIGPKWTEVQGAVLAFRADGSLLSVSSSGQLQRRDATGQLLDSTALMGGGASLGLAVDVGRERAYVADTAGTVVIVDLSGAVTKLGAPFVADTIGLAVSQDGTRVATVSADLDLAIRTADGSVVAGPFRLPDDVRSPLESVSLQFAPDGAELAVATMAGRVDIIDARTGATIGSLTVPPRPNPTSRFAQGLGPLADRYVTVNSWSPDGRTIALGGLDRVLLYDAATGELLHELLGWADIVMTGGGFSPDSSLFAVASFDGTARLVRVSDGTFIDPPFAEGGFRIGGVGWFPDGRLALSNWKDSTVDIVDPLTRESAGPSSTPFGGASLQPTITPDGSTLVVGSTEGKLRLVDVPTGEPIGDALPLQGTNTVGFVVDGGNSIIGVGDPFIRFDISADSWANKACAVAARNLTQAEWKRHFPDEPYHRTCPAFADGN